MGRTIILYGATGYSGRLIAAEGERLGMNAGGTGTHRMILAGRDGRVLSRLARQRRMEHRVFGLEDRADVVAGLAGASVVVNAAGPFALTANHLAKAALVAGCHYVDINGEADVYLKLDDLGRHAAQRGLAMVSGAGHTAAASNLLLAAALTALAAAKTPDFELGAVRIAMSHITTLSRGSTETLFRSLREQVTVIRRGEVADRNGRPMRSHVLWHEPAGKLERTFDFGRPRRNKDGARRDLKIASAASLVDTLTARLTLEASNFFAHRIESYVETGTIGRIGYQVGALLAPAAALPLSRGLNKLLVANLPAGPTRLDRDKETHSIVVEIEDRFYTQVVDWCWSTPNPYEFTARVVLEIARTIGEPGKDDRKLTGWLAPSQVVSPSRQELTAGDGYLRGCQLSERRSPANATAKAVVR
jgi:short subunit dehydrogenase-like uncharacterized protein